MAKTQSYISRIPSQKDLINLPWNIILLMFIALLTIGVWVNLLGYSPMFLESIIDANHYDTSRYIHKLGQVLLALCFFLFPRFFEKHLLWLCGLACVIICVVTSLFGLDAYQTLLDPVPIQLVCQFLMGLSYSFFVFVFYMTIASKLQIKAAILVIVISQVLEQIASNAINALLSTGVVIILCIALPLISCAAFLRARSLSTDIQHEKISGPAFKHTVTLIVCASLALAMVTAISIVGFWGNARVDYFTEDKTWAFIQTLIACAMVLILSYFTIYRRAYDPLSVRYRLPFLVVIAAFFCVVVQSFFGAEIAVLDTAILSVEFLSHALFWIILVSATQNLDIPPLRLIGGAYLLYAAIWFLWQLLESISTLYSNILLAAICFVLIVISTLSVPIISAFNLQKKTSIMNDYSQLLIDGELPLAPSASNSDIVGGLKSRCSELGKYYGLTAREIDVLILIAQGRSHTRIEEELTLSESTVKTHIGNIFAKMKVHSRQDIIDLVFEKPESKTE